MAEPNTETSTVREYFLGERPEVILRIPEWAQRVLDVGCGAGLLGKTLKERGVKHVVGVELDPAAAQMARQHLDAVYTGDVASMPLELSPGEFDTMVFADVLEHLVDPTATLMRLKPFLAPHGVIITSIPNVRYYAMLNHVVEGNWTYAESGILDRTHLRFFTIREMVNMLKAAGFNLIGVYENMNQQYFDMQPTSYPAEFSNGRLRITGLNDFEYRDLFVFQYILVANNA
ncbi:MAG: class I SAM-dependent methyltransferase [Magnetococcales bacterium]|nr:class I SAM-dependent methyltransferase [Magnetococcales bacterium]